MVFTRKKSRLLSQLFDFDRDSFFDNAMINKQENVEVSEGRP